RRLAATGGPGHQDDAVRAPDQVIHDGVVARREPQIAQIQEDVGLLEQTHHDALVIAARRHRGDAHVDAAPGDAQRDAAVLGQALLGDIQPRHDLHARDDRAHELTAGTTSDVELAVDAVPHDDL